jgi:acetone carboxylase gamma subunit
MLTIANAIWEPAIVMLVIQCSCGHQFNHRADRWRVRCLVCGEEDSLEMIRHRHRRVLLGP